MAKLNLKYIGYVNNYDKDRYLEKIWKAAVYIKEPHVTWVVPIKIVFFSLKIIFLNNQCRP